MAATKSVSFTPRTKFRKASRLKISKKKTRSKSRMRKSPGIRKSPGLIRKKPGPKSGSRRRGAVSNEEVESKISAGIKEGGDMNLDKVARDFKMSRVQVSQSCYDNFAFFTQLFQGF